MTDLRQSHGDRTSLKRPAPVTGRSSDAGQIDAREPPNLLALQRAVGNQVVTDLVRRLLSGSVGPALGSLSVLHRQPPKAEDKPAEKKPSDADVEKQWKKLVEASKFDEAIKLVVDTYHLPTTNLAKIAFDASVTDADATTSGEVKTGAPQTVLVGPSAFKESFAHFIRIVGHELQHVQQRTGAKPITNQNVREFLAFAWEVLDTTTPSLTPAERVGHAKIALKYFDKLSEDEKKQYADTEASLKKVIANKGKDSP
jgi:hypothetical protein